ncbi:hypothetical protein M378DRAFT_13372 [Amanita muscaria Koide BX008]|uniref:Uncharacterized protein n=1 Tax=Amanita muscaria (strain Koide BX008) TaxID=946122 RepID=A0A0C2T540_AMAMK|nr:hypothetical protein M378DRAFT_13372 [Amanita muscaria Koide BX008]
MNLQAPKDLKDTPEDYVYFLPLLFMDLADFPIWDQTLVQTDLKDISPEHFPIWGETLGYDRGLSHFSLPPEFSEQGVLIPTAEGYAYRVY